MRAAHVIGSVGWVGLVVTMLVLGVAAAITDEAPLAAAGHSLMARVGTAIIPAFAIATLGTGIVLSVATPWGLFRHHWVVVKLVLGAAVIVTGIALTDRWIQQALIEAGPARSLLVAGSAAHLLMLGAATVISVDKPWGKTRRGRRLASARARDHDRSSGVHQANRMAAAQRMRC